MENRPTLQVYSQEQCEGNTKRYYGRTNNIPVEIGGCVLSCEVIGGDWQIFSDSNCEGVCAKVKEGQEYNTPNEMGMPSTGAASARPYNS